MEQIKRSEKDTEQSFIRKLSVGRRITLMVILISVIPILAISIYSYAKAFQSARTAAMEFAGPLTDFLSAEVSETFHSNPDADPEVVSSGLSLPENEASYRIVLIKPDGSLPESYADDLSILEKRMLTNLKNEQIGTVPVYPELDRTHFVCCRHVEGAEWLLVLFISNSELVKPLQSMFFVTLFGTIILLIIAVAVIDSIDRPMSNLVRSLKDAAQKGFEVELKDENPDEMGMLTDSFNEICREMKGSMEMVRREQDSKRTAEIRLLQAQINPHFLFNTLDSLRFTSMMSNVPTVSNGLAALSHLLRSSVYTENAITTLREELRNVEDYLVLQRLRLCESIELNTDIEERAYDASIMKLLLQPIVENSVIHGLVENQALRIDLKAAVSGGMLHIEIRDNGQGFDMNTMMQEGNNVPKSSRMSGIGLANVRDRLVLNYKDRQSFEITSQVGAGTLVRLSMPYTVNEDHNNVQSTPAG